MDKIPHSFTGQSLICEECGYTIEQVRALESRIAYDCTLVQRVAEYRKKSRK